MITNQVKEIITYRKRNISYRIIADLVGCCKATVAHYVQQAGMTDPSRTRAKYQSRMAMLLHDWNCGTALPILAKRYDFASMSSLYTAVSVMRKKGMRFAYRNRTTKADLIRYGLIAKRTEGAA